MHAWWVERPGDVRTSAPLRHGDRPEPRPRGSEVRVRVRACGVCRTDLHLAEGDLPPRAPRVVPGHEVVGVVDERGPDATRFDVGDRIGIAWLRMTCGRCRWCRRGEENLCVSPAFTGWDADGGYAEHAVVDEAYAYPLPDDLDDEHAAPLLCAGIIGYRALKLASLPPGGVLGVYGFGASAHLAAQVAIHQGARVHALTRSEHARQLALTLGAASAGGADDLPPEPLDAAILFAPVGDLVPVALAALASGGTLAVAGIHLTDVPSLRYEQHLFRERVLRSVTANTRRDGEEFLRLAGAMRLEVSTQPYPLDAGGRGPARPGRRPGHRCRGPGAVMSNPTRLACALAVAALLTVACGSRLPDSQFPSETPAASTSGSASPDEGGSAAVGVTDTTITIGNIVSRSNPFDARAFVGPYYGVSAFVDDINRRGGIDGRKLVLKTCDDFGSSNQNVTCVHQLLDRDHVFALVGNGILNYAGARIVNDRGVPDIGSQPIDLAYTQYPHLWDINGNSYPRDGKVGYDGELHGGTEVYRYFKVKHPDVPLKAGVVFYNQASSKRFGRSIVTGLEREGYKVVTSEVNFALPDYDAVAIKMRNAGVRYVYDTIDRSGNERLCVAMDENRLQVVAKVTTTQSWEGSIRSDYSASPNCRNTIYATGNSRNYDETDDPQVTRFRAAMDRLGWDKPSTLSEWALEGWAGAQWFADAVDSCDDVTRECVEGFLARPTPYTGHGLLLPRDFVPGDGSTDVHKSCLNVARWQDDANGGDGGWVTQPEDMFTNCFMVPSIVYQP